MPASLKQKYKIGDTVTVRIPPKFVTPGDTVPGPFQGFRDTFETRTLVTAAEVKEMNDFDAR